MTLEQKLRDHARETKIMLLISQVSDKEITPSTAAKYACMSEEEFLQLMEKRNSNKE